MPAVGRLPRRAPATSDREALQAPAERRVLVRPRVEPHHLAAGRRTAPPLSTRSELLEDVVGGHREERDLVDVDEGAAGRPELVRAAAAGERAEELEALDVPTIDDVAGSDDASLVLHRDLERGEVRVVDLAGEPAERDVDQPSHTIAVPRSRHAEGTAHVL